jgi:hypothetical protein
MRNLKLLKLAAGLILAAAPLAALSGPGAGPALAAATASHPAAAPGMAPKGLHFLPRSAQAGLTSSPFCIVHCVLRPALSNQGVAEVYQSSTADFANVDLWSWNGTNTQKWDATYQGCLYAAYPQCSPDSIYTFHNVNSGKCMETYESQLNDFANVDQYQCNGTATQEWIAIPIGNSGYRYFENYNSYLHNGAECLDVHESGTADGTNIDQYQCDGTPAQQWYVGSSL